jgi:hypothetical protein
MVALLGGCRACDDKAARDTPPAQAIAKDAATEVPPAPPDATSFDAMTSCDRMRDLEGLKAEAEEDANDFGARFACDRAKQSGWAVRRDMDVDAGQGTFTALHAGKGAAAPRSSAPPDTARNATWPPSLEVYDFDGDGEPELFTALLMGGGAREWIVSRLFVTYKNGVVAPYARADGLPVDHFEDVDKDGRPDLVLEYEAGQSHLCDVEGSVPKMVTLVAHTLADGTFSLTDAVARGELAKRFACKGMPARVVQLPADADAGGTIAETTIVCGRLFGAKKEDVVAEIDRVCAPYATETYNCRGPCRYVEDMHVLAKFDPPVTFSGEP